MLDARAFVLSLLPLEIDLGGIALALGSAIGELRGACRWMRFKSPMWITPLLPVALRSGGRVKWLKSQWKLAACPAQFRVEINTQSTYQES